MDSDIDEVVGIFVWIAVVAVFLVWLGFGINRLWLHLDTGQQDVVRVNITHQAPRVIADNEQLHQECADIKTDRTAIEEAQAQIASFKETHDLHNLTYSDQQTYQDLQTNLAGTTMSLEGLRNTYDAFMGNSDIKIGLDDTLPTTSSGC